MGNQKLGILAVAAAVMVLWATVQSRNAGRHGAESTGPTYLIQGLNTAQIGSIVIGQGDKAVTIRRDDKQFVVANEANYPVDAKQINDLITKSLDVKTVEAYTSDPANHEELEVTEAKARHVVKFFKPDGSLLTGIVIGKSQENGQTSYVRLASDNTVYLAANVPWLRDRALDYVDQELVTVKRDDVNVVTVTTPEGSYTLRPGSGDAVTLADLPADKTLKDSDAKSVFTGLMSLRFDDVNTPAQIEGLNFDHHYVCRMDDQTEYQFHLAKKGDKTYVTCEAEHMDPTKVSINPNAKDSEEELKKKEAKLLSQANAQKFTLRHKGWVYEVPDWKAKYLTMSRSALLEEIKKEPEATAAEPNQPAAVLPATPPVETQDLASAPVQPAQPPAATPTAQPTPAATTEPNQTQ